MAVTILWLRNDLRLADNPALHAALEQGGEVLPVYIHDPHSAGEWAAGAASEWWLHHSLRALDSDLRRRGSRLCVRSGDSLEQLQGLLQASGATRVVWNRRYEPWATALDRRIKQRLREDGIAVTSFSASLLYEPWSLLKADGTPYRVFTPYWNAMQREGLSRRLLPLPERLPPPPGAIASLDIDALGLLPTLDWADGFSAQWQPGEAGAQRRLEDFLHTALATYGERRDLPAADGVSGLAAHLHFGEIGPAQLVLAASGRPAAEQWLRQLAWREFAAQLLYHFPHTPQMPLNSRFAGFPWATDYAGRLRRWQQGLTGIPLVDAGMRELWQSGTMHNRVRMVVASFLTKNLLVPWQEGAAWFWQTLLDADLANNSMGWQWVAGCGADAAPYYRIFNPVLQGEKFDPKGEYVRRWLPELASLPDKAIHAPWKVGGVAGYPPPMVDLKATRERALAAYATIKG